MRIFKSSGFIGFIIGIIALSVISFIRPDYHFTITMMAAFLLLPTAMGIYSDRLTHPNSQNIPLPTADPSPWIRMVLGILVGAVAGYALLFALLAIRIVDIELGIFLLPLQFIMYGGLIGGLLGLARWYVISTRAGHDPSHQKVTLAICIAVFLAFWVLWRVLIF